MKVSALFLTGVTVLLCASAGEAQHKSRSSDEIARDYNATAKTIQDEIDALRKKLDNSDLSMSDAARLIDQQSALRKKADDAWKSSRLAIDESFSYKRQDINKFNQEAKKMDFESAIAGSRVDLLNNTAKYPEKSEFEKNKEAMSKAWEQNYGSRLKPFGEEFAAKKDEWFKSMKENYGIDLVKEGYGRIGTYNPYTGEVYYKYYDKDGKLNSIQWQDDAKGWEKYTEDSRTYWRRRRQEKEALEKDIGQLQKDSAAIKETQKAVSSNMTKLESVAKRVNFVGSWRGGDTTGNNNTVSLRLNSDGTLTYSWQRAGASYSGAGTWQQAGRKITARTNDGKYDLRSSITEDFRLEFNVDEQGTGSFRVYLNR